MPKSLRHKSSKYSSRDAREYSDSEKESSMKERKVKEEGGSRVSKDSASIENRKLNSKEVKDLYGSGNGEYSESKRRKEKEKEKIEKSASDRWNGRADHRGDGTRKTKEVKSKRREDGEGEETKNGSAKSEGKHRESGRKEGREGGVEKDRERKEKEGKIEKLVVDKEAESTEKKPSEITELYPQDKLRNPEPGNQLERRIRKRRNGSGDEDKHQEDIGDINDRRLSSNDDTAIVKDGRLKDEKHNDERYRNKYQDDVDKGKHRDDKQRDDRLTRDHTSSKSVDKHLRDGKDTIEIRLKKSKPLDGDRDHYREPNPDRNRDRHRDHERDRGRDRDRCREREHDREHDWYWDHDSERDRNRYRDWDWDRERDRDHERDWFRDRDCEHDQDIDGDGPTIEERSARYKDSRGKKRSADDRDDHNDINTRGMKARLLDMEKKALSNNRVESDADRGTTMNNRRRSSPNCSSDVGLDEYRHVKKEDLKYSDYATEQRPKAISREVTGFSGVTERLSKYRSMDRPVKMDDGHMGELSAERSSSSKASPMDMVERSPSSTSVEHKFTNRSGGKQSLDIEETGRKSSDRLSQDLPVEKLLLDESSQADSSFYNRTSQGNSSSFIPLPPTFRAGLDSPFLGSLENDSRVNYNARHKRNGDPNVGRGPGIAWRGLPNWRSRVPNGFFSYQHGPPHGGFPAMMPQFPPPLFGVRPSMEISHSGMPYQIPDADRFSSHLRPIGWQNMLDGSGPSHLHGWDGNNAVFRDEPHIYGNPDWDQNRLPMNGRGWQTSVDMWKGKNGDVKMDLASQKEDSRGQVPVDDVLAGLAGQQENNHHEVQAKSIETRPNVTSQEKTSKAPPKATHERASEPSMIATSDGSTRFFNIYLSKLDISAELANLELYNECMISLDVEHGATAEDTSMHVILKNGARAGLKTSNALRSCPLFPAINDSVFQKAMNLYKQSIETRGMPIISGRTFDMILASNQNTQAACKKEKAKESVPTSDPEMSNVAVTIVDQKRGEAIIAAAEENLEGQVSTPQDIQAIVHVPPIMVPVQALSRENSEEKSDGMIAEQVDLQDGDGNIFSSLNNSSHTATILPTDGGKANGFNTAKCSDEFNGPLVFSDGSPKASETLMPGSNESESVIFGRIHHSSESTH